VQAAESSDETDRSRVLIIPINLHLPVQPQKSDGFPEKYRDGSREVRCLQKGFSLVETREEDFRERAGSSREGKGQAGGCEAATSELIASRFRPDRCHRTRCSRRTGSALSRRL
jgi:hypothetical protein